VSVGNDEGAKSLDTNVHLLMSAYSRSQLNIADAQTGGQGFIEIDDEKKL
jgi:hypothetical protein